MSYIARSGPEKSTSLPEVLGQSPAIAGVREQMTRLLERHARSGRRPPLVIEGETGSGKGLLARALHRASAHSAEPFIEVDCTGVPEALLEAEPLDQERAPFGDPHPARPAMFQHAQHGTIFLDEVGLLPRGVQARLLKAVEYRGARRRGNADGHPVVDVWIIAASNEDLAAATRAGRFREDLYHRLAAVTVRMPPLRERGDDVLLLAERFLARGSAAYGLPRKVLAASARAALLSYAWPGNVRELANAIERVVLLSDEPIVTADCLGLPQVSVRSSATPASGPLTPAKHGRPGRATDRGRLVETLQEADWKLSLAAERLGVPRNTLRYWLVKLDIQPPASAAGTRRAAELSAAGSAATSH